MTPERFRQIEELYHAAREGTPEERVALLARTEPELRREVESLLAQQGGGPLARPAVEAAAKLLAESSASRALELTTGQTVDRYRILAPLGAGGMGMVYTAQDSRLERTVALKFLLEEFTGDREALERFRREARALSALNHPNICTIYDIGEAGGRTFIAMEYVAGKRLDRLIARRGLPLNEALKYATQIADALSKAHAAGIVHRDLKPANIMVTGEGLVKVLDFGLAKLAGRDGEDDRTLTAEVAQTEQGTIVGTASYMSPEQAQGKQVDSRSDIFSFGAVLYEMLTARRAFQGDTKVSTLASIARDEPASVCEVAKGTPRELDRIIARCLRKDPERRFQTAADLKVALLEVKEESESGKLAQAAERVPQRRRVSVFLIAVCALLFIAAGVALWLLKAPKQEGGLTITRMTSDSGLATTPAISPDGKLVAYASDRSGDNNLDIWVQQVAGGQPIRLTTNPADDYAPDFSPDGSRIVFRSNRDGGGVYMICALGGEERLVAKSGTFPRFSPDGKWIAYYIGFTLRTARIYIVSSMGGTPRELNLQIPWAMLPLWSPDGRHLLFLGSTDPSGSSAFDWWVAPAEGGQAVKTGAIPHLEHAGLLMNVFYPFGRAGIPSIWNGDRIIFSASLGDSANLWQVPITPDPWQIKDPPQRLTNGADQEFGSSLAADGRLVFATTEELMDLWALPIVLNSGKVTGNLEQLTRSGVITNRPALSSDGRKLVFVSDRSGNADIWLRDMDSGKETALTATPWAETHPLITADGSKVVFMSQEGTKRVIQMLLLGKGMAEKICDDCGSPLDWSGDGRRILYYWGNPIGYSSIDVVTRQRVDVIRHAKYNLHRARFSPDGNWLAFHVPNQVEEGISLIAIAPLRNGMALGESEWIRVTDGTGIDAAPWWSPDMGILYFLSQRDGFQCIWAQHLDKATQRPVGAPFDVYHFHGARHKVIEQGFGPGITSDKLVFTLTDSTGNIWTAKTEPRK